MLDTQEVAYTLEHLRTVLENLVVKGLGSASVEQVSSLTSIREECERIGAYYLSESVANVVEGIQSGSNTAAGALMKAQATLRVFERILTLENASGYLELVAERESDLLRNGEGLASAEDHS